MRGSLPFACTLSLKQKHLSHPGDFFHFHDHDELLAKDKRIKKFGACFWPQGSLMKVSIIDTDYHMIPNKCATTIQSEPLRTQFAQSLKQSVANNTPTDDSHSLDKFSPTQVPTQEKNIFDSADSRKEQHEVVTSSLPSSDKIVTNNDTGDLQANLQLMNEDFLLYGNLDEEMSSDLDSSLEGKLLIDESMSEEEVDQNSTKDNEMVHHEVSSLQADKPASKAGPDLCQQELQKDKLKAISSSDPKKKEDCTVAEANGKRHVNKENDLEKMNLSYSENLDLSEKEMYGNFKDGLSTCNRISEEPEENFRSKHTKSMIGFQEEQQRPLIQQTNINQKNSEKFFNLSDTVVLEKIKHLSSGAIIPTVDQPLKEVNNNNNVNSKDTVMEQEFSKELSAKSLSKTSITDFSMDSTVPRTVSPDSTTYTGEEFCKLSFVFIEDYFVCLSCSKRFKNGSVFKRHVWLHFHDRISSKQPLCKLCLSNKDFSQCPAVKEIFTMLQNSCSKEVSSLCVKLLLNPPTIKDKNIPITNQIVLAKNLSTSNSNCLSTLRSVEGENRASKQIFSTLKRSKSQIVEHLTILILSHKFLCTSCYQRITATNLPQHIYCHVHASSLPEHGPCVSEKECSIMGEIIPIIPSLDICKDDCLVFDISWKRTVQQDLKYQILLIRHKLNKNFSSNNNQLDSIRKDSMIVRSSSFLIPNPVKENCLPTINLSYKPLTNENTDLDSYGGSSKKVNPSVLQMKIGYKRMIFVIKQGHYICTACKKGYGNLDRLKAHIMWHFHSQEKICSLSHYEGLPLQENECPILTNIFSCIPKVDKEKKMLIVYWKKNTKEKTSFQVKVVLPKENPVIDLTNDFSDNDDDKGVDDTSKQYRTDNLKEETIINIDDTSLDSIPAQNENVSICQDSSKPLQNGLKETKESKHLIDTNAELKSNQKVNPGLEKKAICVPTDQCKTSHPFENIPDSSPNFEGGFYVCAFSECKFSSIESEQFLEHLEKTHFQEKTFPCIHCGHEANSETQLMKHLDTHANHTLFLLYHCSACEFTTNLLPDFEKHLYSSHAKNNRFLCRYCKQSFPSIPLLLEHLNKNLLKFIMCPFCSARDIYRRRMLRHLAIRHPNTPRKIVVASQIICKIISANKNPKKEIESPNDVIVIDETEESDSSSLNGEHTENKEELDTFLKEEETELFNNSSTINLLNNLVRNLGSTSTMKNFEKLTDGKNPETGMTSENGKSSFKDIDLINDDAKENKSSDVEISSGQRKVQKNNPTLIKLLSNTNGENEGLQESFEIASRVKLDPRKHNSSERNEPNKERQKKHHIESYVIKDQLSQHCNLKILLKRMSVPEETENKPPSTLSDSGTDRNVFQLFDKVEENPDNLQSQCPGSEFEARHPGTKTKHVPSLVTSDLDGLSTENSINNDSAYTETISSGKIQPPSLLQEINLGGSTLDLHLRKCYTPSNSQNQGKNLHCSICRNMFKTVYSVHMHLLSEHFKWPLWECQDCGARDYSHWKISTHCWRVHKNQTPRIKSLDLPVIELNKDNEFAVVNIQAEFVGAVKPILSTEGIKKAIKSTEGIKKAIKSTDGIKKAVKSTEGVKKASKSTEGLKTAIKSTESTKTSNKSTEKAIKAPISAASKPKTSSTSLSASLTEDPKSEAKSSRKRSKSTSSDNSQRKKKRISSCNTILDTNPSGGTSNALDSMPDSNSVAITSGVRTDMDSLNGDKQPPKKKSKISSSIDSNAKICSTCDFNCTTDLSLFQHRIQEHKKEYQHNITDHEIEMVEEAITGDPLNGFTCPFCSHNTKQRVDCKIHIWRQHARLKLLDCSQCNYVSWFECHLERHVNKKHSNKQKKVSSKEKETLPVEDDFDDSQPLLTRLATASKSNSEIPQNCPPGTSTHQVKLLRCKNCKYVTLLKQELEVHLKKHQSTVTVNGTEEKEKSSNQTAKVLQPSKSSSKTPVPKKKKNTVPASVPLQNILTSDKSIKDKDSLEKNSRESSSKKSKENKLTPKKPSTVMKKSSPVLKTILPKPPFPLEKKSSKQKKNSNTSETSSKIKTAAAAAAARSKSAEAKQSNLTNQYVETVCTKTGRKQYTCSVCSVLKSGIADMKNHWKKYQDAIYKCSECFYKRHTRRQSEENRFPQWLETRIHIQQRQLHVHPCQQQKQNLDTTSLQSSTRDEFS